MVEDDSLFADLNERRANGSSLAYTLPLDQLRRGCSGLDASSIPSASRVSATLRPRPGSRKSVPIGCEREPERSGAAGFIPLTIENKALDSPCDGAAKVTASDAVAAHLQNHGAISGVPEPCKTGCLGCGDSDAGQ